MVHEHHGDTAMAETDQRGGSDAGVHGAWQTRYNLQQKRRPRGPRSPLSLIEPRPPAWLSYS